MVIGMVVASIQGCGGGGVTPLPLGMVHGYSFNVHVGGRIRTIAKRAKMGVVFYLQWLNN